jgi:hypothetical protein
VFKVPARGGAACKSSVIADAAGITEVLAQAMGLGVAGGLVWGGHPCPPPLVLIVVRF